MKLKNIYLISLILCVFLTFSTVNAIDLDINLDNSNLNSNLNLSQSESIELSSLNEYDIDESVNEDVDDVVPGIELPNYDNDFEDSNDLNDDIESNIDGFDSNSNLETFDSDFNLETFDSDSNLEDFDSDSNLEDFDSDSNLEDFDSSFIDSNSDSNSTIKNLESKVLSSSVNSYGGALQSSYTVGGNTFLDIQNIVSKAKSGDTIILNGGTFIGNGTPITINKSLNIIGGYSDTKATLNARNLSEIFKITVDASKTNISNCNFINGNGVTVEIFADDCIVINSDFRDNYARAAANLRVWNTTNNFLLENCNFINGFSLIGTNTAIHANNSIVNNCIFINNSVRNKDNVSGYGGALQIGTHPSQINVGFVYNCVFINNSVIISNDNTHGGALCFRPGIIVLNSTFINNYCNAIGGATTLHADGELFNCIFINNSAGKYGGAITTGLNNDDISVNMTNCYFENNSAPMGGAILIKGDDVKVFDSTFINNRANESDGGAIFIVGDNAFIKNSIFYKNFASNIGAGILINGSNVTIFNSNFTNNNADFGAAVFINGINATVSKSIFTNHSVKNGTVFIKGENAYINASNFNSNLGEYGAAVFIEGSKANLRACNFTLNNVSKNGGAIYIIGSNAKINTCKLFYNNAIPDESDIGCGLGGALYIKGDNNSVKNTNFTFNTARNGSAIYTDGVNMVLNNTNFDKNQAWSYDLATTAKPNNSYFNESDVLINITHIGGNNIANAIYNTASINDIYFYNVSYVSSKGSKKTGDDEIHPVLGAENSQNGSLLYQDDREDNQVVEILIKDDSTNNVLFNETLKTGILGNISIALSKPINPGNYTVYAKHTEDPYYKAISSDDDFIVLALVDLVIGKKSNLDVTDINKTIIYTVDVVNNGPNNATGVVVNEMIPDSLIVLSTNSSDFNNNYSWYIGDLASGEIVSLEIKALINGTGLINNLVNVSSNEKDTNESNNLDNKTVYVKITDLAIDISASDNSLIINDTLNWTVVVVNNGPDDASNVSVLISDFDDLGLIVLNSSDVNYDDTTGIWHIGDLAKDDISSLVITTKVNCSNKNITVDSNVRTSTFDSNLSNNYDDDSIEVLAICDLAISINPDKEIVNFTDDAVIDWTITVVNNGPDDASNVSVSLNDLKDLGLDVLDSVTGAGAYFDNDTDTWFIGDLDAGDIASLVISTVPTISNANITVVSNVKTDTLESDLSNNNDSATVELLPLCDLAITIVPDKDTVNLTGDDKSIINWTIVVVNNGPDDASDVSVSLNDLKDLGLDVLDSVTDAGAYFDNDTDTWFIGDLNSKDNASLVISTIPTLSNIDVTGMAEVTTATLESNLDNNKDNASIKVLPLSDLAITIIPDKEIINLSEVDIDLDNFNLSEYLSSGVDIVNWIITVTNNGPDNASGVVAYDILPDDLELITYATSQGVLKDSLNKTVSKLTDEDSFTDSDFEDEAYGSDDSDSLGVEDEAYGSDDSDSLGVEDEAYGSDDINSSNKLNWDIGNLGTGETATLVLTTRALNTGAIIQNVNVTSETYDYDESNNNDSANITVIEDDFIDYESDYSPNNFGGDLIDNSTSSEPNISGNNNKNSPKSKISTNSMNKPYQNIINNGTNKTVESIEAIEMKNTGNPLIVLVLSIFCLLPLQLARKD